jgi:hypothetical protein
MLGRLASLLHGVFDRLDQQFVPLAPELDMLRDYLEIERMRFYDRLRFDIRLDSDKPTRRLAHVAACLREQSRTELRYRPKSAVGSRSRPQGSAEAFGQCACPSNGSGSRAAPRARLGPR